MNNPNNHRNNQIRNLTTNEKKDNIQNVITYLRDTQISDIPDDVQKAINQLNYAIEQSKKNKKINPPGRNGLNKSNGSNGPNKQKGQNGGKKTTRKTKKSPKKRSVKKTPKKKSVKRTPKKKSTRKVKRSSRK